MSSVKNIAELQSPIFSFKFGQTFLLRRCPLAGEVLARHRPRRHRRQAQAHVQAQAQAQAYAQAPWLRSGDNCSRQCTHGFHFTQFTL